MKSSTHMIFVLIMAMVMLTACNAKEQGAKNIPDTGELPITVTTEQTEPVILRPSEEERPAAPAEHPVEVIEAIQTPLTQNENAVPEGGYRAIAYVTVPASDNWRWIGEDSPDNIVSGVDTRYVTHINFAFGMLQAYQFDPEKPGRPLMEGEVASQEAYKDPTDGYYHYRLTVDGWIEEMDACVSGGAYLRALTDLKQETPDLKVLLSVGGWDSDGFCYMARTAEGRAEFIQSCVDMINAYNLDGIDLDWEYPTNGGWGVIANCPHDVEDCRALLREMRAAFDHAFDRHMLLTIASGASQPFVDAETFEALDYINVMCYDFQPGSGKSQSDLANSKNFMKNHADMVGNTPENRAKINLGIPFYNEGGPYLVPYYKGYDGHIDASPALTREKMEWVRESGYGGAFYWAYSMDVFEQDVSEADSAEVKVLQRTVYETLNR